MAERKKNIFQNDIPYRLPIILFDGDTAIELDRKTESARTHIRLDSNPDLHFWVDFEFKTNSSRQPDYYSFPNLGFDNPVRILGGPRSCRIQRESISVSGTGFLKDECRRGNEHRLKYIRFLIPNLQHFSGEMLSVTEDGVDCWRGRLSVEIDGWHLDIDAVPDGRKYFDEAARNKRYSISHVGTLRKTDQEEFSFADAHPIMDFLHWGLTFINGSHCGAVLVYGYGPDDQVDFEGWTIETISTARKDDSWFLEHDGQDCIRILPDMLSLWKKDEGKDQICFLLGFYAECNRIHSLLDVSIIVAQALSEMLCAIVLTNANTGVQQANSKKRKAAAHEKLTQLIAWCNLSPDIPQSCHNIHSSLDLFTTKTGPGVITEIRNALVHPTRQKRMWYKQLPDLVRLEAWQLIMWYIDLVLLKLFGYDGPYNNRLGRERPNTAWDILPWSVHNTSEQVTES